MLDSYSKKGLLLLACLTLSACVSASKSQIDAKEGEDAPIENPFGNFSAAKPQDNSNITLRTKRGENSVEVEFPQDDSSELAVPMNPMAAKSRGLGESGLGEVGENGVDYQYLKNKATSADREIASTFNNPDDAVNEGKKREIESDLGLQTSDEPLNMDESYLAKVDVVKQLFHNGRFEAGLIEIDHLIKMYPTSAKLYEMRGTLLDRMGYSDLAVRSWKQALEFQPRKLALKKMIEKREAQGKAAVRGVASEPSGSNGDGR